MLPLLLSLVLGASPSPPVDTLVFCPVEFSAGLAPWIDYRRGQGRRIVVLNDVSSPETIRAAVRSQAAKGGLRYVLLVGDASPADNGLPTTPTFLAPAKVNVHWGSEPLLATDNWFVDLDDDISPDVAIGRLTADNGVELETMVRKIIAYESAASSGPWRRRLNFVAGVGGFGPLVDTVVEKTAKKFITSGVPACYQTTMTYASWRSPYCPDPRAFRQTALARMNEGCLFWIYMGHGQRRFLDLVQTPAGRFPIMDMRDAARVRVTAGAPIAVFLACYTGAFDEPRDCLAEELLSSSDGPVAVLAGSRVTMPYAMAVFGDAVLREHFHGHRPTLGELLMHAKRRLVQSESSPETDGREGGENSQAANRLSQRQWLDTLAKAISPAPELLDLERAEHAQMFNLLGDPLLQLAQPTELVVKASEKPTAGGQLVVSVENAVAGRCTVELVCRRDRLTFRPPLRTRFVNADRQLAEFDEVYRKANDQRWTIETFDTQAGPFRTTIDIPVEALGAGHVRVMIEGHSQLALGAADISIRRRRD